MSKVLNTFPGKRIQLSSISKSPALTARIVPRGNIGPSSTCTVTVFKEQTCQQWHSWINLFLRHPDQLFPDGVLLPWPGREAARLLCRPPHLPRPAQSQLRWACKGASENDVLGWFPPGQAPVHDLVWQGGPDQLQHHHQVHGPCLRNHRQGPEVVIENFLLILHQVFFSIIIHYFY